MLWLEDKLVVKTLEGTASSVKYASQLDDKSTERTVTGNNNEILLGVGDDI